MRNLSTITNILNGSSLDGSREKVGNLRIKRVPGNKRKFTTDRMKQVCRIHATFRSNGIPTAQTLILKNNRSAKKPTYAEVVKFLEKDVTDEIEYTEKYKCTHYAVMVHNNAEKYGIKCGFVCVTFVSESYGHAVNAWSTSDHGVIFTDSCGHASDHVGNDKLVTCEIGKDYIPVSLLDGTTFEKMGVIQSVDIIW